MTYIKLNDINDVQARLELILRANQDSDGEVRVVVKTSKNYLIDSTATVKDGNVSFYINECNDELVGQVVAWTFESARCLNNSRKTTNFRPANKKPRLRDPTEL